MAEAAVAEVLTPFQEWSKLPADQQIQTQPSATEIDTAAKTAPASEPEPKPAEPEAEPELPKGLKKRFSELTGEIRELRAQLAMKGPANPPEAKPGAATPPESAKAAETGKPVAANFTTYEEYVEALADWKLDQRDALKAQLAAQSERQTVVKTQVEAARAAHPDYDEVVTDQVVISPAMAEVMTQRDFPGAEVAYILGSDPAEAKRIAALSPAQAGAALARIAAGINPAEPPKPKAAPVSKAPPPPKTLAGTGGNADSEPDPSNFKLWNAWADREEKRKRGE